MTPAQRCRLYFPAWQRLARHLGWRMLRRRLLAIRLPSYGAPGVNTIYQRIWDAAEALASAAHRAVTDTDLRHACTVEATGAARSSLTLTNSQTTRVIRLFDLLRYPDSLEAFIRYAHPELDNRAQRLAYLDRRHPAYVQRVCRDMFGVADWHDLNDTQIRRLWTILHSREAKAESRKQKAETADCPF